MDRIAVMETIADDCLQVDIVDAAENIFIYVRGGMAQLLDERLRFLTFGGNTLWVVRVFLSKAAGAL